MWGGVIGRALAAASLALVLAAGPADAQGTEGADADTAAVAEARERIEAGDYSAAARLLEGWLERHPDSHSVRWLLARTLYWDGEPGAARRQLRRTLEDEPGYPPARELWREMRGLWAPRLRLETAGDGDIQPLTRQRIALAGEVPFGARVGFVARSELRRLEAPAPGQATVLEGRAGLRVGLEGLDLAAVGGAAARPASRRSAFVGRASLGIGLPAGLELEALGRRWSYEFTSPSVEAPVLVETGRLRLAREDPAGPAGEAAVRMDRFPDGNRVRHAWAWALLPLWSEGRSALRVGYGFQAKDADASTFVPGGGSGGPGPIGPGGGPTSGVYDPYYTPEQVRVHSALAAVTAAPAPGVLLSLDGAVGVRAREEAPEGSAGGVTFTRRSFTPWRLRGRLAAELSPSATLRVEGGYEAEAFFRTWSASAGLEWTFLGGLEGP